MSTPRGQRADEGNGRMRREVHVTEITAALRDPNGKRGVYVPNNALKAKLTRSFNLLDKIRQQQERHLLKTVRLADNKDWLPDPDYVKSVTSVATSQRSMSSELRELESLEIAARQGLTDEQMGRVVDFQLVKRAGEMAPEQAWKFAAQRWNDSVADVLEPAGRKVTQEMA